MNLMQYGFIENRDKKFIIIPDTLEEGLTFGEVNDYSTVMAKKISQDGIGEGDRVCILIGNKIEHIISFYALLKLKAIPIILNIRNSSADIKKTIEHCQPRKVLVAPLLFKKFIKVINHEIVIIMPEYSKIKQSFEDNGGNDLIHYDFPDRDDEDLLMILYTSGTTGFPKGAMIKFNGWMEATEIYGKKLKLDDQSIVYQALPLWQGGAIITFILSVLTGSTIVLIDMLANSNFYENYWNEVEKYKVNYLYTFPGILSSLLLLSEKHPNKIYPKVKYAKVSSAVLLPEIRNRFEKVFGIRIIENYGSNEGNAISITDPDEAHNGSVGKIIGTCPVKISETGEILIKNQKWFKGYLFNPDLTKSSYEDDWFKMVDIGKIENGYIYLFGRTDVIINSQGEKISPSVIDNVILKHEHVFESYSFGYSENSSIHYDDKIISFVSLKNPDNEDINKKRIRGEILSMCIEQLPKHYIPENIYLINEIPKTTYGKISRENILTVLKQLKEGIYE